MAIPKGTESLTERLIEGRQILRRKHREGDAAKLGNLRAGNSGIMSSNGDVAGSCHRVAHLRALGIDLEEPTDSKLVMFQMGTANEDVVYRDLLQTSAENEVILREEEIPTEWLTSNGTKVTGRPDMVVCRSLTSGEVTTQPLWGVELKSVASVYTSKEVLFEGTPKMAHLIQAGHYAWQLGIPFRLMYKQYVNQVVPQWAQRYFPKEGAPNSEHCEYNDKGEIKYINPFEVVYELEYTKAGYLRYRREDGSTPWTKTIVTWQDIERFYEAASTIGETGDLGKRPLTVGPEGKEKSYSNCNYCKLKPICDKVDKKSKVRPAISYEQWLAEVKKETGYKGE